MYMYCFVSFLLVVGVFKVIIKTLIQNHYPIGYFKLVNII